MEFPNAKKVRRVVHRGHGGRPPPPLQRRLSSLDVKLGKKYSALATPSRGKHIQGRTIHPSCPLYRLAT